MRAKLSVLNRLSLLGLLDNKGDLTTIKVIRELREELSFTPEEHIAINFQPQPGGKLTWNEDAFPAKEFEFTGIREIIVEKVKTQLREMEKKGELLLDYLPLYETLIEEKEEEKLKLKVVKEEKE